MTARAFFMTRLADPARAAEYESWVCAVDYPFTRRQPSVAQYEIVRINGAVGDGPPPFHYVELIEVHDAVEFPTVFEQAEAAPIIEQLRSFIEPGPIGLVGHSMLVSRATAERTVDRVVLASPLGESAAAPDEASLVTRGQLVLGEVAAATGYEAVRIMGRYKSPEPPAYEALEIIDLGDSDRSELATDLETLSVGRAAMWGYVVA